MFIVWNTKQNNDINDIKSKMQNEYIMSGTILEWFVAHKWSWCDAFITQYYFPPDAPENIEGYLAFYNAVDANDLNRTIVEFIPYNGVFSHFRYVRTIFGNDWQSDWVKLNYS